MGAVLNNVEALRDQEEKNMGRMRQAKTAAELRAILGGHAYGDEEEGE
jgi:hypothetical protein